ncbi:MAG: hypothetical protein P0Y59_02715 [Candidatus Sphingomonas phytovorans]|nr:hypothetical protein [Sphingomonas sp.]WEK00624.1 MAG: hypothetical protein P0Y59_02715 [Sphingomonas sp.]
MPRWLAVYSDDMGDARAAVITTNDPTVLPFGVDNRMLGLDGYNDGGTLSLVSVPEDFRPDVIDVQRDAEVALQFIDL